MAPNNTGITFEDLLNLIVDEDPTEQQTRRQKFQALCVSYKTDVIKQREFGVAQFGRSQKHDRIMRIISDLNVPGPDNPKSEAIKALTRQAVQKIIEAAELS